MVYRMRTPDTLENIIYNADEVFTLPIIRKSSESRRFSVYV